MGIFPRMRRVGVDEWTRSAVNFEECEVRKFASIVKGHGGLLKGSSVPSIECLPFGEGVRVLLTSGPSCATFETDEGLVDIMSGEAEGDGSLNDVFSEVPISLFPVPSIGKVFPQNRIILTIV